MQNTTQKQTLTNVEKTFIVDFLANSVYSLTQHNVTSVLEKEQYFERLVDAQQVIANLQMLYNTATIHSIQFNFTIAQAAQAMLSYETEYRDTVCEQFAFACTLELHKNYANTNANFATLLERLYNNY